MTDRAQLIERLRGLAERSEAAGHPVSRDLRDAADALAAAEQELVETHEDRGRTLRQYLDEKERWDNLYAAKDRAMANETRAKTEARAERDRLAAELAKASGHLDSTARSLAEAEARAEQADRDEGEAWAQWNDMAADKAAAEAERDRQAAELAEVRQVLDAYTDDDGPGAALVALGKIGRVVLREANA